MVLFFFTKILYNVNGDSMKKFKYLLLIIGVILVTGCGKLTSYKEISYKKMMEKIEGKESFILYIGRKTCSNCEMFKGTLNQVISKYQIEIFYVDTDKMSDEEIAKIDSITGYGGATPYVFFVKDGETSKYRAIKGREDYDYVVSKMKTYGYINE